MSPPWSHIDPSDSPDARTFDEWIAIKASHRDNPPLIQTATENLPRPVEAILPIQPLLDEPLNEVESLRERFGSKLL